MTTTFDALGVAPDLCAALAEQGKTHAFAIQELAIADAIAGRDVCGKAKTGSGKTLAFGLPVLQTVKPAEPRRPRALILVPTRELATQVCDELAPIGAARDLRVNAVYGGADIDKQINKLKAGVEVIAAPDLLGLLNHLKGEQLLAMPRPGAVIDARGGPDLRQVKGQETAKRALEIAAAGSHNLLMVGPPGAGKSLMAARLPGILPPLDAAEALEVSMVQSVAGTLAGGRLTRTRPFRAPHHSASMAALTGGGLRVKPGEVSMAHLGVLFLDELPEFQRAVLDSLRQPLETGEVSVARANAHVTYPARVKSATHVN